LKNPQKVAFSHFEIKEENSKKNFSFLFYFTFFFGYLFDN